MCLKFQAMVFLPQAQVQQDIARIVARHHIDDFVRNWQQVLRTC